MREPPPLVQLIHPAPAGAVMLLAGALGAILTAAEGGSPLAHRLILTVISVAGSQILTGALNDWADRDLDRIGQPGKPIPRGTVTPRAALGVALAGGLIQLAASIPLGPLALLLGAGASASAVAYNLWLSRTPASVLPYLVSFSLLPAWIAAGVDVPLTRVAGAMLLVGPFAAAAHLANVLRDWRQDRELGSRNLAQVLGRATAHRVALGLALAVGLSAGVLLGLDGRLSAAAAGIGGVGLLALAPGAFAPSRLWVGMLVAAVCWTVAWGLATS